MIDTDRLRGAIKAKGMTIAQAATAIGMAPSTMQNKLSIGIFGSDEIEKMIALLDIQNPGEIFFPKK